MNVSSRILVIAALTVLVVVGLGAQAPPARTHFGFSPNASREQDEIESRLQTKIAPVRIEEHLRWLTSRAHRTGTEGARATADYLLERLREYGFETELVRYDAHLPAPISVAVEMVEPSGLTIPTTEEPIEGDPFTEHVGEHPGWNGYSASGDVTAQVVYGHYGSVEDFEALAAKGVDFRGKIVLLRYYETGDGRKVANAERLGASAVLLYADPEQDGFPFGDVYPKGNWRPSGAIMRRSVEFLPYSGDPLSPGWASVPGARRLSLEEVKLPAIPVVPISSRSAETILRHLAGPPAPLEWQGALPLTYRIGPGPAKLHVQAQMDNRDRPMWNVIGRLPGETSPDQWVGLGNHHDAWIFGAGDPSSGTAALLELCRGLGELAREGHRPRRTLVVAFWDAEEMLLGGSTEWVEEHGEELLEKAVAYINMDSAVFNTERPLSVAAHPVLHRLFRDVARDIKDPRTGKSLFEAWRDLQNQFRRVPGVDGWGEFFDPEPELERPYVFEAPYDDASPFFNHLALPSSDMYYGADYGMYHSIYENFHWMKTVVDPDFSYHALMASLQGRVALRLANADVPPLDYVTEADYWRMAYRNLEDVAAGRQQQVPGIAEARELIERWDMEARSLEAELNQALAAGRNVGELAKPYYLASRDFLRPADISYFASRNLFSGDSLDDGLSGSTLPGIRFALDKGDLEKARQESEIYLAALRKRLESVATMRRALR
jgi:N-acetylated-alpha-linked acidic dipeptidase